jgi:hypothetical protein
MTIRLQLCVAIALSAGVVLMLSSGAASAAVPIKKGTYRGKTSQNRGLVLKMSRRSVRRLSSVDTELRTQCGGRKLTLIAFVLDARVSPSGRIGAPRWTPVTPKHCWTRSSTLRGGGVACST